MKTPRRRFLQQTAVLLPAAGLSGLIAEVLARGNDPRQQGMRKVSGEVTVNGQSAVVGTLVKPGDTVATGKGSEAIYVVGQDAYLQRESTSVAFTKDVLRIISGKLLSVFGRVGLYEILLLSSEVKKLLAAHGDLLELRELGAVSYTHLTLPTILLV